MTEPAEPLSKLYVDALRTIDALTAERDALEAETERLSTELDEWESRNGADWAFRAKAAEDERDRYAQEMAECKRELAAMDRERLQLNDNSITKTERLAAAQAERDLYRAALERIHSDLAALNPPEVA